MTDRSILDEFYWFSAISDESFEKIVETSNWNINESLKSINDLINHKVSRILSLLSDSEIESINNTECFDDVVLEFEWIDNFCDKEYDILEERFNISRNKRKK